MGGARVTGPQIVTGTGEIMADLAAALAKRGMNSLTDDDLHGNDIKVVKCRACSGYGACGYKTFFLYDGTPYSVCNLRLQKVQNNELTPEQQQEQ